MLNSTGIKKTTHAAPTQILFNVQLQQSVGVIVSATGITAGSDGKKIVKAGTPLAGDLTARGTAFAKSSSTVEAVGVLLHDVDVTAGNNNGTLLIFGFVNLNRLDTATVALITSDVKEELNAKVTFLK